jgi:aldehyde dehydrogenase (NAD+)
MDSFQNLFEAQKALFATNVTRTYEWRIEQLDRMGRTLNLVSQAIAAALPQNLRL